MRIAEKLLAARGLLERALHAPEPERAWLLALAWGELQEGIEALAAARDEAAAGTNREAPQARPALAPALRLRRAGRR